jgi:RimJ/RimL family protein N-acetyltransferase
MNVCIRRATVEDASAIRAIRQEPSARRYQPLREVSLEELAETLAERAALPLDPLFHGKAQWVIDADGEVAGWVSLDVTSREHGIGAVGYTVAERFRGRGFATSAVRDLMTVAFDPHRVDLDRLEAVAAVENVASQRVLTRAGFQAEGIARGLLVIAGNRVDHVRFGLLRSGLPTRATSHVTDLRDDARDQGGSAHRGGET